ncbi:thioredoxin-disulfide reductase [Desulfohalobiaceae bacterium Ax17]|jgi:thioredoxin reductase (NADPH)|uniref:thioredoxin-disulfide reductase n=1 Tax=Desulfovulcanus ferrireducens TaxID=2831190 RepID=UPI00207BA42C|nr:thioredoxin-disulfide reductase [Desulfovulcanus ferrireducens]MBT8764038.1 thioredoxin-disulfide reductase [Desulfovulcanus ferrireducens]
MKIYDALVIGAGPAGTTAALYLLRSGVSLAWAEKLSPGGQMLLTERVDNYPGFPRGVTGYELAETFAQHLQGFSYDRFQDEVLEMKLKPGASQIKIGDQWIEAKTVIICSGVKWKKLGVKGEDRFVGRGLSYCALCDGNFFKDQVVACIGGGNTALEESLYLSKIVKKVYLIHRRDKFRGAKIYQEKVFQNPKIEIIWNTVVQEFVGENELQALRLKNVKTSKESMLPVSGAFIFIGVAPQADFVTEEIKRDADGFIITDAEMRTNIPGIFAAGDIRSKLCRQISTAVGDGTTAANSANLYLEGFDG